MKCPQCASPNYFYLYINNREIVLCRRCSYWEAMTLEEWQSRMDRAEGSS